MKTFEENNNFNNTDNNLSLKSLLVFLAVALFSGAVLGYAIAKFLPVNKIVNTATGISSTKAEKTIGIADKKTFKDQAEGTLREGGVDGEGNFHLERPGGVSQNVYLTSTTVDMLPYVGKKVRVWGQTFTAEKAGWLMDVGLVEILQ